MTTDRSAQRADFLKNAGWADAAAAPLAGDASTRSYERLQRDGVRAVLMNAPPAAEGAACPPDATPEERRALGYNACARLAGPNLKDR
ncbi:MAG: aminoglycoside phosphotransferase, partial [Pseudomonadota bacterium]